MRPGFRLCVVKRTVLVCIRNDSSAASTGAPTATLAERRACREAALHGEGRAGERRRSAVSSARRRSLVYRRCVSAALRTEHCTATARATSSNLPIEGRAAVPADRGGRLMLQSGFPRCRR